jgi:hypothetical protein
MLIKINKNNMAEFVINSVYFLWSKIIKKTLKIVIFKKEIKGAETIGK